MFTNLWIVVFIAGLSLAEITEYKRVCYYTSWATYRQGVAGFTADNITDPNICTHYIYAFAGVDADNKTVIPLEEARDEKGGYKEVTDLKKKAPDVKVLLALGGWSFGVEPFINLTKLDEDIDAFCDNTIHYLRQWNFDGIDVDWEYPTQRGGSPEDRQRFVILLQKLRASFEKESEETGKPRLLLTSAVPILKDVIVEGYDRKAIGEVIDFLNIMVYDLYGSWSEIIGHHAPLYSKENGSNEDKLLNVEWGMKYWSEEVDKEKLILGLPLYSRTFHLYNATHNNIGDAFDGPGSPGPYTLAAGVSSYYEVCKQIKTGILEENWDDELQVPYAVSETEWVGYDNPRSAMTKANYVKDNQYGGIMLWELSFDDFGGIACEAGKFPILNAIKNTLTLSRDNCPRGTYGTLNTKGCTKCKRNTYQPEVNQLKCIVCDLGQITLHEGSTGSHELDCASGSEYDYTTRKCEECPTGYFRNKPNVWCLKCPLGFTTVSTGSSKCVKVPGGYTPPEVNKVTLTTNVTVEVESCGNEELVKSAVLAVVKDTLKSASESWKGLCTEKCSNVRLGLVTGCLGRQKRQAQPEHSITFEVVLENIPEELTNGIETRPTHSLVGEILNDIDQFAKLTEYQVNYQGVDSITVRVVCPLPNHVVQNGNCVPCAHGSYYNPIGAECTLCGIGTYQDQQAASSCKVCPGILTTKSKGSDSNKLCLSDCEIDADYCKNNGVCIGSQTSITCECKSGYEGKRCEQKIEKPLDKSMVIAASVGGTIGVLLIVLIIVTCCACWKYSRRPRKYEEVKEKLRKAQSKVSGRGRTAYNTNTLSMVKVIPSDSVTPTDYLYDYYTLRSVPAIREKK